MQRIPRWVPLLMSVLLSGSALGAPPPANAEPAKAAASKSEFARTVEAAVHAYNEGHFADARAHFERAHQLKPSARTLRGMGACDLELGHDEAAVEALTRALADERSALTPELRRETEAMLATARQRLTQARATASAPAPAAIPAAVAQAEASGQDAAEARGALPSTPVHEALAPRAQGGMSPLKKSALAIGSVGVAGIVAGAAFGIRSMRKGSERDDLCGESGCSERGMRAADAAITAGNWSTATWIVGGVGLASGVALWWAGSASDRKRPRHAQLPALRLGLAKLELTGRW